MRQVEDRVAPVYGEEGRTVKEKKVFPGRATIDVLSALSVGSPVTTFILY